MYSADELAGGVRALARVARMLERSTSELSFGHYRILTSIASGHERAAAIATLLSLGRPTVSAAVDSLARRGLLTRAATDADGRVRSLALTPSGVDLLHRVEAAMTERLAVLCDNAPDGEALLRALVHMGEALDAVHADHRRARDAR
ncbi:MarR family winged helix-turn-helix transcriptional regulator [Spelaeicoccus albus]|uniref:DNA-binding MarR family transcriptional regulator n=1 Tax=Spelaeicoccus albus TaxID=1280376 RepID=A0A7Z0IIE4_9MICO|nr:MarR family transcriptional regulator [Spelaeicoccus albus]NYI68448.1 DNA-binding MarR family transcriptional regulator [Spelaeicoccus albus]